MSTTVKARPAALTLTPAAEARIVALMAKAPEGAIGVHPADEREAIVGRERDAVMFSAEAEVDERAGEREMLHRSGGLIALRVALGKVFAHQRARRISHCHPVAGGHIAADDLQFWKFFLDPFHCIEDPF